ncbi:HISTONE ACETYLTRANSFERASE TYPE B CATALYTIC SUBUNIT [Salix purpurea]|uniref:histone acetyltransferase n=1 Tax=Salix purpurea TaxID=77065 RepID=A0A9Q0WA49_SALPP|nr:HISTONE ACETYLTRANSFERASE TYPE B CATALYTIC SUBUNIT [Salix purpurea]
MGQKQQPTADPISEPKKRRRVGFSNIDDGIEANQCILIYLVSSKEEVGASHSFRISPVDLNSFFDEDGKIYGYNGLKITIWVSSISFHAFADIKFQSTSDGGKGITDLKSSLQRIFADTLRVILLDPLSQMERYCNTKPPMDMLILNSHLGTAASDVEVVRMVIGNTAAGHLYSRLVPLVLLLIDGSNPIDVEDPGWELYVLVQKKSDEQGDGQHKLLGFTAVYRFYHYPDSTRLRLSQILVLPPYQHKGYGGHLVEVLSNVAILEDVYDLTVEEPLDYFQHVRTSVDIKRLLHFAPIQEAVNSTVSYLKQGKLSKKTHVPCFNPPASAVEDVRKTLKINRKQFLQCWEVLIYLGLDPVDKYMEDFVAIISSRVKADVLGKDSGSSGKQVVEVPSDYNPEMSFAMFRSQDSEAARVWIDENQTNQEEQLQQLVDERVKEIKLIAQKVHHV